MNTTDGNLKEAFAGESQANRKYVAFARKAQQEGFVNVGRLFRAAAEAETIHALGHLSSMKGVRTTAQNLQAAFEGETHEYKVMYPPMIDQAVAEDHPAKRMFNFAAQAEAVHAKLYTMALESVKRGKDLTDVDIYLCPVCGYIELGKVPGACPICGGTGTNFVKA